MKKKSLLSKLIVSGYILSTIAPTLTSVNQVSAETADVEVTEEDIISLLNEFVARLSEGTDNEFSELTTENLDQEQLIRIVDGLHNHKEEDFEEAAEEYTPLLEQEINNNVAAIVEYFLHLAENRDAFGTEEAEQIEQLEELVAALSTEEAEVEEAGEDEDEQEETEEEVEADEESESEEESETEDSEVAESSEEEIEETSEVDEAAEVALYNQAASDLTADEHYTNVMEAGTASSAWNAAQEFKASYPNDTRLSEAFEVAAERNLRMGQNHHVAGNFNQAIDFYERLVNEEEVSESMRSRAADLLVQAEDGTSLSSANSYYESVMNAGTATNAWNAAQEFKTYYPNDTRLPEVFEVVAERNLRMGENHHVAGNLSQAINFYERLVNEEEVPESIRSRAAELLVQAENGTSLTSANSYYESVINAGTATSAWEAAQEFQAAYPNHALVSEAFSIAGERMLNMGNGRRAQGRYLEALDYYTTLVEEENTPSSIRNEINGMLSDVYYEGSINASTASQAWEIANLFQENYPNDDRIEEAINSAAERIYNMGRNNHRIDNFQNALYYYNLLSENQAVGEAIRSELPNLIELAENGVTLRTESDFYNDSINAGTASEAWNIAVEGMRVYPTSVELAEALDQAADRIFALGRGNHTTGNFSRAIDYYDLLINEPAVDQNLREIAQRFRDFAQNGEVLRLADEYAEEALSAPTASSAWSLIREGLDAYPDNPSILLALEEVAERQMSMGVNHHRSENYSQAIEFYSRITDTPQINENLRQHASSMLSQAQDNRPVRSASQYASDSRNANTASASWEIASEGSYIYPNNNTIISALNDSANRQLRLGRNNHRAGDMDNARTYFDRVQNEPNVSQAIRTLAASYSRQTQADYRPVVFVDAGHGGSDPGAVHGGVTEASLNISTSRLLRDELNVRGYEVVMIRNSDQFIELADRAQNANDNGADLFLSIHYNSMGGSGTARGIETFIFHRRPQGGLYQETNRNNFNTDDPRIDDSLRLADETHNRLIQQTGMNDRGVKGNNFHVVRETYIPAVLFELGFIDNDSDLARIRQTSYQQTAAKAIADGVDAYFGR